MYLCSDIVRDKPLDIWGEVVQNMISERSGMNHLIVGEK